ncbi:transfer complex protein [Halogeometricum pallidum JCM 14848]|uniref:Transfer complex protein n=1 Tax=Halogeometricum pallidum JCM 14848 TaxID=1227487 RepID=M0CWQ5_HALPD|nr:VirB4 family type IV secretion system protein [Halogeometricum pallidum]ELZ27053.1 transfer complex protein [Halogeometricum pallidum JCM 14848]
MNNLHWIAVACVTGFLGILSTVLWIKYDRRTEPYDLEHGFDESFLATAMDERVALRSVAELQQETLAPSAIEWETRAAKVGEQWTSSLTIAGYPDYPADGYLNDLFNLTDVEFDCTVRLRPLDQERARKNLRSTADDLSIDSDLEEGVRSSYLRTRAQQAAETYSAVENGQQVFSQSMVVTVRAETREELDRAVRKIRRKLRDHPANLTPKTAVGRQDLALQTASPLGPATLGREATVLGGAVGALLASVHNPTILEPDGVEVGVHRHNDSPVVIDAFARDNGYAMFTVGEPGSGKSFGSKQNFLRSIMRSEDRIGVILEPLNNWAGVAEALGAQRITVGGNMGLNPLDIKPTPKHIRRSMSDDASPFKGKIDDVLSFLMNYFALRGVTLGDRRTTLELAVTEAYARKGITEEMSTHGKESPTMRTVLDVLTQMTTTPESFVIRTNEETAKIEADAPWLIDQLRSFAEGGRYENLGNPTEFDIRDEKVIYLDLGQQEGTVGGSTSLLMQLLISLVYERAKETDKEVVFVIDEARYIMQDVASLGFLETVFRHHRHHDLSIRLVTQTVDEFFQHPESEAILDQCAIKQFHRLSGMDETWANEFGLNHAQMRFVQNAIPGNDRLGYSEALIGVDGEWRGIEVRAMEQETQVIDYEPAAGSEEAISEQAELRADQLLSSDYSSVRKSSLTRPHDTVRSDE